MLQQSLDYLHIPVTGPDAPTLTAQMVAVSFAGPAGPWITAADYTYDPVKKVGTLKVLVGPGSTVGQLPTGAQQAYVKITAAPTQPVIRALPGPVIETL